MQEQIEVLNSWRVYHEWHANEMALGSSNWWISSHCTTISPGHLVATAVSVRQGLPKAFSA
jgi:hypothetical protein